MPDPEATTSIDPATKPPKILKPKPKGLGYRHWTTFMLFIGMANAYVMRTNMSVAIVAMTNPESSIHVDSKSWSTVERGLLLSSFFYGYVLTQIPIGLLTKNHDSHKMLAYGMVVNAVFALLVPVSSQSIWCLAAVRFIQGMGEGPIVPCTHAILAKWIPPGERSFLGGIVYSGAQFGTIISYPVSGYLAYGTFLQGWPAIFYVFGVICLIWCVLFIFLVYENPHSDKRVSVEEKEYILYSIFGGDIIEDLKASSIPWGDIVKSGPFLSILVAHMGQNFGYETLMTMLPTFLKEVLHFDMIKNGIISATPYIAMFITSSVLNYLADYFIRKKILSTGATRKLMTSIGEYGPGLMFIIPVILGFTHTPTIVCLILAMACNGGIYAGFKVNHIDISPCFAGILMSITNCSANVVGMLAPTISGLLLNWFQHDEMLSWKVVFLVSAVLYITCATVYLLFSSGRKQYWDKKTAKEILSQQNTQAQA
ncbi:hypothetical protein M8J76_005777 [Diaphorina citri]|nr:hypothetical protein M8J75_010660 [Diaphorina citri]KAI5732929.1 hypothetical protein M8J76_005777 [Diaphorina citri]KAI5739276.1 hypothetical protein M8J77_017216 [Diaphorina citri]